MIEWIKRLGDDLMPEETTEPQTAKERATSREHADRVNALGRAQVSLAKRGIMNPTVAELYDERDRLDGVTIANVDLHDLHCACDPATGQHDHDDQL